MAQDTDRLRHELDDQRAAISETVDQIENRVVPGRVMARNRDRMQSRLGRWKETVFGSDGGNGGRSQFRERTESTMKQARSTADQATDAIGDAPRMAREQTSGSPLAAGAVALAAGWLVGGLLPGTRNERQLVEQAEPQLAEAASTVREEGTEMAEDLRGDASDAFEQVKDTSREAGREAASEVRQRARS